MKIGIISEGHADRAVITNILIGLTGLDISDIEPIRPIYNFDETDKAKISPKTFSSWTIVKDECQNRELIDGFLAFESQDFVIIHIDTAEADEYGVKRPSKNSENYCEEIRDLVIQQINNWLDIENSDEILYAVAVEEIDAWILTIYEQGDSSKTAKPKEKLSRILRRKEINSTSNYDNFLEISRPFSKEKEIKRGKFLTYNCSLEAFYHEVKEKILPKIEKSK